MIFRHSKNFIQLPANRPDRAVADDRERSVDVHAGREAVGRISFFVHALIEQADADDFGTARQSSAVRPGCGFWQRPAASRKTRRDAG